MGLTTGEHYPALQSEIFGLDIFPRDIVKLSGAYYYGVPTDPSGMIRSIREGRPFIFAWEDHVYVRYALNWIDIPQLRVIELHLIDPYWKYGRAKFRTFSVFKDDPRNINGTFELLLEKLGSG